MSQYFMLSQMDETNPDGAKFYIDGTPLGDGRTFFVPAGGELVKTLEVEKGTAMVYHDLQLVLHSTCQYDRTGFQDLIGATVSLNAEFTPSCTDLTLASPLDQWVLNSESPNVTEDGKYFIPVTVTDFDVNYENFHHIDIQFKGSYESDDRWVTKARFYKSESDMNADTEATCEKFLIEGADILYNIILDEATDVDQSYDICAVSACREENSYIETVSNISTGTKDTYRPRLFGQPQPADGILGVEDEVRLNFNENIGISDTNSHEDTHTIASNANGCTPPPVKAACAPTASDAQNSACAGTGIPIKEVVCRSSILNLASRNAEKTGITNAK